MKKLIAWLKDPRVLTVFGLIALGLIVWFGGPMVSFGADNVAPLATVTSRLIALLVIVGLWGLNNMRQQWSQKKKEKALFDDVKGGEVEEPVDEAGIQSDEEVKLLQGRFDEALQLMKKSGAKTPIYDLPWYIIIGPPGSGKTTALLNSGLHFPLAKGMDKAALGGVGGTRHCDWWFTNDAIFIDTAGRYTTQDSHRVVDSGAWKGFLALLKKHRARRPINGAIIAVSAQDLLTQPAQNRQHHATVIRERVDELIDQLGIDFPIYFMLTKMDLVAGFNEFFGGLRKEEREQVWGVTYALNDTDGASQGGLGAELDLLIERINAQVFERLEREKDLSRRAAIQGFPLQVAQLKSTLVALIDEAFSESRFSRKPLLRGVYLTSATQQGNPIDRVMAAVASKFSLRVPIQNNSVGQGKSFFLGRLIRDVIFAESEIVGVDLKHEKRITLMRQGAMFGMVGVAVLSVVVWGFSFSSYGGLLNKSQALALQYEEEKSKIQEWNHDPSHVLPTLATLKESMALFETQSLPWLTALGLYDASVPDAIEGAYQSQLKQIFLPRVINQVEKYITTHLQDFQLQNALKVYLMLGEPERYDSEFVTSWLSKNWSRDFAGHASDFDAINYHFAALTKQPLKTGGLNQLIVDRGRTALSRMPVALRIYNSIKGDKQYGQQVDLLTLLGDSTTQIFVAKDKIDHYLMPYLFTKAGYKSLDLGPKSPVVQRAIADQWVVGQVEGQDFSKEDIVEISEKVKELYLQDYIAHWQNFLNGLDVSTFETWDKTQQKMAVVTDPVYSPLLNILQITRENTQLTPVVSDKLKSGKMADTAGKLQGLGPNSWQPNAVDKVFRDLNGLLATDQTGQTKIAGTMAILNQLKNQLNQLHMSGDAAAGSYKFAKVRMNGAGADVLGQLRVNALNLPEPVQLWVNRIGEESWLLLLSQSKRHLNRVWEAEVLSVYSESIAARYPIAAYTPNDLAIDDFAQFFGPGGVQDEFVKTYLKPFIDIKRDWKSKMVDGHGLSMNFEALAQLKRAARIKKIYFKGATPKLNFQIKPRGMDATVSRFELDLGNQIVKYTHGPKLKKNVQWPSSGEYGVRVAFEDLNESKHQEKYEGPWAFFRLLDKSKLRKSNRANEYRVTFSSDGRKAEYTIVASSSKNPFSGNDLRRYKCPNIL